MASLKRTVCLWLHNSFPFAQSDVLVSAFVSYSQDGSRMTDMFTSILSFILNLCLVWMRENLAFNVTFFKIKEAYFNLLMDNGRWAHTTGRMYHTVHQWSKSTEVITPNVNVSPLCSSYHSQPSPVSHPIAFSVLGDITGLVT